MTRSQDKLMDHICAKTDVFICGTPVDAFFVFLSWLISNDRETIPCPITCGLCCYIPQQPLALPPLSLPDQPFLIFFFSRLRSNRSGRYEEDFPFLSPCGRERNFVRCDDHPVVFTHLLQSPAGSPGVTADRELLSYCGGAEKLSAPFRPEALYMHPASGRLYHPCSERAGGGGVGLVRSALAIELSPFFVYAAEHDQSGQPTHFHWGGRKHTLTNELAGCFPTAEETSGQQDGPG